MQTQDQDPWSGIAAQLAESRQMLDHLPETLFPMTVGAIGPLLSAVEAMADLLAPPAGLYDAIVDRIAEAPDEPRWTPTHWHATGDYHADEQWTASVAGYRGSSNAPEGRPWRAWVTAWGEVRDSWHATDDEAMAVAAEFIRERRSAAS